VQKFFNFGDHNAVYIFHFDGENRFVLRQRLQFLANVVDLAIGEAELRTRGSTAQLSVRISLLCPTQCNRGLDSTSA
jgi:hypothetical protein